jgi:hypothetical protein
MNVIIVDYFQNKYEYFQNMDTFQNLNIFSSKHF